MCCSLCVLYTTQEYLLGVLDIMTKSTDQLISAFHKLSTFVRQCVFMCCVCGSMCVCACVCMCDCAVLLELACGWVGLIGMVGGAYMQ